MHGGGIRPAEDAGHAVAAHAVCAVDRPLQLTVVAGRGRLGRKQGGQLLERSRRIRERFGGIAAHTPRRKRSARSPLVALVQDRAQAAQHLAGQKQQGESADQGGLDVEKLRPLRKQAARH